MEDYEVRDLMFRQKVPRVECARLRLEARGVSHARDFIYAFFLSAEIRNTGVILAEHFAVEFTLPRELAVQHPAHRNVKPWDVFDNEAIISIPGSQPLFPNQVLRLSEAHFAIQWKNWESAKDAVLRVTVYAGNATPVTQEHRLGEVPEEKGNKGFGTIDELLQQIELRVNSS